METVDLNAAVAEAKAAQNGNKRTTRLTLDCFDGSYDFQLSLSGMAAIEAKANMGIGAVYTRIMAGRFRGETDDFGLPAESAFSVAMVMETVRQGLIGGNKGRSDGNEFEVTSVKANSLIENYLSPENGHSLIEAWNLASAIMHAAFVGIEIPKEGEDA